MAKGLPMMLSGRGVQMVRGVLNGVMRRCLWLNKIDSQAYWTERYKKGKWSGNGSYGKLAKFKASVLNSFVREQRITHVIEFGCGDGNQLRYAEYPSYRGYDISSDVISLCEHLYCHDSSKSFHLMSNYRGETAPLTLSLDVIYHLLEDETFEEYMEKLFQASTKYVVIYSSDTDQNSRYQAVHVKHRKFSTWVEKNLSEWILERRIPNDYPKKLDPEGSNSDFFIYKRRDV